MFTVLVSNFHTSACIRVFRTDTFILPTMTLSRDPAGTQKNSKIGKSKNQRPRFMKYYWNQMMNGRKKKQENTNISSERSAFVSVRPLNICLVVIEKLKLVRRHIKCLKTKIKIINNNFSIRTLCFSSGDACNKNYENEIISPFAWYAEMWFILLVLQLLYYNSTFISFAVLSCVKHIHCTILQLDNHENLKNE